MVSVVVHVSIELAPPPRSNMFWALKKAQKAQNPSLADRYSNILQRFENFINPRPARVVARVEWPDKGRR